MLTIFIVTFIAFAAGTVAGAVLAYDELKG